LALRLGSATDGLFPKSRLAQIRLLENVVAEGKRPAEEGEGRPKREEEEEAKKKKKPKATAGPPRESHSPPPSRRSHTPPRRESQAIAAPQKPKKKQKQHQRDAEETVFSAGRSRSPGVVPFGSGGVFLY